MQMDPAVQDNKFDTSDAENSPFLAHSPRNNIKRPLRWNQRTKLIPNGSVGIHLIIFLSYTAAITTMVLFYHEPVSQRRQNALKEIEIDYEQRQYSLLRNSPYIGQPSDSVDASWNKLFSTMSLRVSDSELLSHQQESVALPKGGNLAWLGVYHELHCVKVLRQTNYREYYHPNAVGQELRDLQVHADHCVDLLRESIMCHGDTESLTTFVWRGNLTKPLLSPHRPYHRCMNWDLLMESLRDRVVDESEMKNIQRPINMG